MISIDLYINMNYWALIAHFLSTAIRSCIGAAMFTYIVTRASFHESRLEWPCLDLMALRFMRHDRCFGPALSIVRVLVRIL